MREEPHRLIFVDECGTKTNMTRARGRARRGVRLRDHAPFRHGGTQTPDQVGGRLFIAGLRYDGLVAPWVLDGPMNQAAFEAWVETQLAPNLHKGEVVILDRLAVHRSPKGAALLRERGVVPVPSRVLARPPHSRGQVLNPIEMAFAKLKAHLRRIGARTLDALWRAVGEICGLFDPDACWNFFKEAGYVSDKRKPL